MVARFIPVSLVADKIRAGDQDGYWLLLAKQYLRGNGVSELEITELLTDPEKLALTINRIDKEGGDTVETEIAPPQEEQTVVVQAQKPEVTSRSLTSEELKLLLEEYEIHKRERLDGEGLAQRIQKSNPLLRRVGIREILAIIEKKIEIQRELEAKGRVTVQAELEAEQRIVAEQRLTEVGIEAGRAEQIAAEGINEETERKYGLNREQVAAVEKVVEEVTIAKKTIEVTEEKIAELTKGMAEVNETKEQVEMVAQAVGLHRETGNRKAVETEIRGILRRGGVNSPDLVARTVVAAVEDLQAETAELLTNYSDQHAEAEVVAEILATKGNGEITVENAEAVREYAMAGRRWAREESPRIVISDQAVLAENRGLPPSDQVTAAQVEVNRPGAEVLGKAINTSPDVYNRLVGLRAKLEAAGVKMPTIIRSSPRFDALNKLNEAIMKDPNLGRLLTFLQRKEALTAGLQRGVNQMVWRMVGKPGVETATRVATNIALKMGVKTIAGQTTAKFVQQTVLAISRSSLEGGLGLVIKVAATKGATMVTGGAAKSLLTAIAGLTGAVTGPPGWVVTALVIGAGLLWDMVVGVFKKIGKVMDKAWVAIGIDTAGLKRGLKENLGGFLGGLASMGLDMGMFVIGVPVAILGGISMAGLIAVLIPVVIVGMMIYMLFQLNLVSQMVPPKGIGGGNCVLKEEAESSGMINCDQQAPEIPVAGVTKANFVRVANTWRSGKNYAEECFNDVVNRSLCAGVNPAYTLWAWVHESGASNYSIKNVEDFGVHGQASAPAKNFNAQLNYFLKLDPGKACLGAPKIGSNYWLGLATNYLNGSCDPDEKNPISGGTGRKYLEELKTTWSWISNNPLPANIYYTGLGGQNCSGSGSSGGSGQIVSEYNDENGKAWVCYDAGDDGEGIPDFEPWDPSIPVPEGCPSSLPTSGTFTQGPFARGCSHQSMSSPAIDLGTGMGTPIVATHPGVAVLNHDNIYGFYIDVHGKCEGRDFYTRYAHMPNGGFKVGNNQKVTAGQQIGVVDNTGSSTGAHLHYHIVGLEKGKFGQYLGLSIEKTRQLWGCCGSWNGVSCP